MALPFKLISFGYTPPQCMGKSSPTSSKFKLPSRSDLFTALASTFFTLLLLEIGMQIWYRHFASQEQLQKYGLYEEVPPKAWQMQPHHYLNYALNPDYKTDLTKHNSFGFRGAEIQLEKPDSLFRIVCLGGSTTYSAYIGDDNKAYPFLVEQKLKLQYDYKNIEVINAGVPGYNSWESLINLQFKVLDLNPDMIIVYHGTNDVHPRFIPPQYYRGDNSGRRKQWEYPQISIYDRSALLRFLRRHMGITTQVGLETMITPVFKEGPVDQFTNTKTLEQNPPIYFERNLRNMVAIAEAHGVKAVLATWAYTPLKGDYASTSHYIKGFQEGNELIKTLGIELDIPVYDFAAEMPQDLEYWEDGRHVSYKGVDLKAELFAKFIHENQFIPSQNTGRNPN